MDVQSVLSFLVLLAFVGMNLFRIIQESVNNAVKHSESTEIAVTFVEQDNQVEIMVEDQGKGFDMTKESTGNGLQIMRNRAQKAGIDFRQAKAVAIHPEGKEGGDQPYVVVEYTGQNKEINRKKD